MSSDLENVLNLSKQKERYIIVIGSDKYLSEIEINNNNLEWVNFSNNKNRAIKLRSLKAVNYYISIIKKYLKNNSFESSVYGLRAK